MFKMFLFFPILLLLSSCGGGGGGSSSTSMSADRTVVQVVSDANNQQTEFVNVTIKNVPDDGLYTGVIVEKENYSIDYTSFNQVSDNTGVIEIQFANGYALGEGTHLNQVKLLVCYDQQCADQIEGSPIIVDTSLETILANIDTETGENSVFVEGNSANNITPEPSILTIGVNGVNLQELFVYPTEVEDQDSISHLAHDVQSNQVELNISYTNAEYLSAGSHTSTYQVDICYDATCQSPIEGSPFNYTITYEVNRFPENVSLIDPNVRTELTHDVIDAEFSSQLNALVIVSTTPRNSLYVYDLNDLTNVNEVNLNLVPTSVSVLNAGNSNKIVVGHDAKITHVEFNKVNPSNSLKKLLNVPVDVFDLVATDAAAYVVPRVDQWVELQRVDLNDNSITTSDHPPIRAGSKIKLHPNLKSVYLANRGLSPSDIEKIDIQTVPPSPPIDSPYHGEYAMCGDLWLSNNGNRIYTACGNTFLSSNSSTNDMTYTGKIPLLSDEIFDSYKIVSVAESSSKNEIAVIEHQPDIICSETSEIDTCVYSLSLFNKDFLNKIIGYAFDKVTLNGNSYFEKPNAAFYNKTGDSVFVVTQLLGIPTQRSYILEIKR